MPKWARTKSPDAGGIIRVMQAQAEKPNRGWFRQGDQRINREGRVTGNASKRRQAALDSAPCPAPPGSPRRHSRDSATIARPLVTSGTREP